MSVFISLKTKAENQSYKKPSYFFKAIKQVLYKI